MATDDSVEMERDEIDAFLGSGGTGVLSLPTTADEPPHTVPVSYGYDAETRTFYFRLSVGADSSKSDLADRPVSFVVHREEDDRWRSVVAAGRLEGVEESGIETETLDGLDRVEIPLVDIFEDPTRVVSFEFYRLVPEDLTGRVESPRDV
ncbi:pyridoxamine 5'-phosphate oxidase family protein [Halomicroarcula limicola]|uniref:Pyridoxamine 5'-phosphate oxidase family protein n=1 Tax=Haloarcula limicola TaxID=1429915 RepID=A0A8J8C6Y3_9EURY|nr:pyridoxamine 5'-phosphate oxidase family protein [Halomicroarcula limicola]MBV0924478.1 pyridoxamine 5'-phosphate oxidase family protein [Halomicroarcula limicola]